MAGHLRGIAAVCAAALVTTLLAAGPASAATTFGESFEGGAVGTKPTAATTAYDETIGSKGDGNGISVDFDGSGYRGHAARFYNTAFPKYAFGFLGKNVGQVKTLYFRRYYRLDVRPQYRTSVLLYKYGGGGNGQLGGTHNGSFAFGGSSQGYKFTLVNNNTNTTTSKAVVPLNAWFRVEVKIAFTSSGATQTALLFLGSNVAGTTPTETISGPLTGPYATYVEDGIMTNPNKYVNVKIDGAVNGTSWPGPA